MSVVFLEAWRSRERAVLVDNILRPWLLGIAGNVVRNSRRSQRRHAAMLTAFHAGHEQATQPDHADAVVAAVDAPTNRRVLNDAFAQLSERDRAVAQTCLIEGQSAAAAAADLGLTEAAVKSRLGRARAHLRGLLQPGEPAATPSRPGRTGHQPGQRHLDAPAGGPHPQETRS